MKYLVAISATFLLLFSYSRSVAQSELVQYSKLVSPDRISFGYYGNDMDISDNYMIIGNMKDPYDENGENEVPYSGSALLYQFNANGEHEFVTKLCDPQRKSWEFGTSVSITDDFALIGCPKYEATSDIHTPRSFLLIQLMYSIS